MTGIFLYSALGIILVDVSSNYEPANGSSSAPSISADGNIIAFSSTATNLGASDTNGVADIFIRDLATTPTRVMGVASAEPNAASEIFSGAISDDGRYIVFTSDATNLVAGDTKSEDVFVYDRDTSQVTRVMNNSGAEPSKAGKTDPSSVFSASISADANFVTFASNGDYVQNTSQSSPVFLYNRDSSSPQYQQSQLMGVDKDDQTASVFSYSPRVSGQGNEAVFASISSNLVANDTNNVADIFLHDAINDVTQRINKTPNGEQPTTVAESNFSSDFVGGRKISADGRYIVFESNAINLVNNDNNARKDIFVYDALNKTLSRVSEDSNGVGGNGDSSSPSISANGDYIAFNTNASNLAASSGIVIYQRTPDIFTNIPGNSDDEPFVTSDGRFTAFSQYNSISFKKQIFLYLSESSTSVHIDKSNIGTISNGNSSQPSVSDDGRYVTFLSGATNLIDGITDNNGFDDIFVVDTVTSTIQRINSNSNGDLANGYSYTPMISADGNYIVYASVATNILSGDNSGNQHIYLYDRVNQSTSRISKATNGDAGNNASGIPSISSNGNFISYASNASNLTTDTTNGQIQIYVYDRLNATTLLSSVKNHGILGNLQSVGSAVSDDGRVVAYSSYSNNLTPFDSSGASSYDIFSTTYTPVCDVSAVTIDTKNYTTDKTIKSEESITTSGSVIINNGVNVTYNAPIITLNSGFNAKSGSQFTAKAVSPTCP